MLWRRWWRNGPDGRTWLRHDGWRRYAPDRGRGLYKGMWLRHGLLRIFCVNGREWSVNFGLRGRLAVARKDHEFHKLFKLHGFFRQENRITRIFNVNDREWDVNFGWDEARGRSQGPQIVQITRIFRQENRKDRRFLLILVLLFSCLILTADVIGGLLEGFVHFVLADVDGEVAAGEVGV